MGTERSVTFVIGPDGRIGRCSAESTPKEHAEIVIQNLQSFEP
jgi:peroxiredoxin